MSPQELSSAEVNCYCPDSVLYEGGKEPITGFSTE